MTDLAASYAAQTIHLAGEQYRDPTPAEEAAIDRAHTAGRCPHCAQPDPCPCMSVPAPRITRHHVQGVAA